MASPPCRRLNSYEARRFPEPTYAFKHALTQEVAYNSSAAHPDTAALHRQVAIGSAAL